jgi:hypothetical protein
MDRQPHPSHDRTTLVRVLSLGAAALLALGVAALVGHFGLRWLEPIGLIGFLAAVGWLSLTKANTCRCPACGRELRRPPESTEFVCGPCRRVWVTRGFGFSLRD